MHGYADCMFEIPPHAMGLVIGPRGSTISELIQQPGLVKCTLDQDPPKRGPGRLVLKGRPTACAEVCQRVAKLVAAAADNYLRRPQRSSRAGRPYVRPASRLIVDYDATRQGSGAARQPHHCSEPAERSGQREQEREIRHSGAERQRRSTPPRDDDDDEGRRQPQSQPNL